MTKLHAADISEEAFAAGRKAVIAGRVRGDGAFVCARAAIEAAAPIIVAPEREARLKMIQIIDDVISESDPDLRDSMMIQLGTSGLLAERMTS